VKTELLESFRKGFVVHQSIHSDARRCRNPERPGPCDALRNTSMQPAESTVELVLGHAVTIDRNEQALEATGRECLDMLGQEPAVGDQPALDTGLRCGLYQRNNIRMNERLAPLECHVANPAPAQDRQSPREPGEIDVAAWTREVLVAGKPTEVARGIAYISYGNIADRGKQIPRCSWCDWSNGSIHLAPTLARPMWSAPDANLDRSCRADPAQLSHHALATFGGSSD